MFLLYWQIYFREYYAKNTTFTQEIDEEGEPQSTTLKLSQEKLANYKTFTKKETTNAQLTTISRQSPRTTSVPQFTLTSSTNDDHEGEDEERGKKKNEKEKKEKEEKKPKTPRSNNK